MILTQANIEILPNEENPRFSSSKRRRVRRQKLRAARNTNITKADVLHNPQTVQSTITKILKDPVPLNFEQENICCNTESEIGNVNEKIDNIPQLDNCVCESYKEMSSKNITPKSKGDVMAAREAKKLAKQKAKLKNNELQSVNKSLLNIEAPNLLNKDGDTNKSTVDNSNIIMEDNLKNVVLENTSLRDDDKHLTENSQKSKDEVDRVIKEHDNTVVDRLKKDGTVEEHKEVTINELKSTHKIQLEDKTKEQIKAERAAKKATKQARKKGGNVELPIGMDIVSVSQFKSVVKEKEVTDKDVIEAKSNKNYEVENLPIDENKVTNDTSVDKDITVRDVVEALKDIVIVAKEVQAVTEKVKAIDLGGKKPEESGKSKAELKAERRAKQEAQRAAKQIQQKAAVKVTEKKEDKVKTNNRKQSPKSKSIEKPKPKPQSTHRLNWFQHLYAEQDKKSLKNIPINSNLHPAVIKLGVQLSSQVVTGSNARCIALLDALKKMVRDYSLPAKTEFARGLEAHLTASLDFLWSMRQPSASQTNAVKHFRRQLTQLPNNVDEFDAKKSLQEEIDRYIKEQIDKAGEAISLAMLKKIYKGDNILTYGCSSLIERILCEVWEKGVQFRVIVVGNRVNNAHEMLRRLVRRGVPCTYVDISALSFVMKNVSKVVVGAASLLVNGWVVGAAGSSQVALVARAHNVPVLVACETHKFSERVQSDAFVYNELGNPDDLIDGSDVNSPLKDWRSNPNLSLLNLKYDVTPPSLVTAVVTDLAILPCTSAPVVLRFKLSEYGI